ncbi:nSTAND1 domain-containing NTPase [Nitrosomonas communis]|uniref:Formylglycine-generating enzyme, required for sulfatase activity, contains SUMF1/FGE domain n=1 Tax=Nitrosomonas communis TaxID=44574 RepID=A0A1I4LVD6_9PROT|nr:SUMF1/EgtB/PvdO family nonheme iron enzyme [Nitrosomonas communis]SFL94875.1 Formylglycine-generating enzyme, required for sulfatase activity, contains SUMF1/FGE domain [Nitrosomonas communis]
MKALQAMTKYNGKQKIIFYNNLGNNWQELADYFEIPNRHQKQYPQGDEAREIWAWLEQNARLDQLEPALKDIGRPDLAAKIHSSGTLESSPEPKKISGTCPYIGLRAFTEDEAVLFFGREPEINALFDKIITGRFLAVIGASGSGKSSLVRAGLLPRLRQTENSRGWEWLRFTPGEVGDNPFMALSAALKPVLEKLGMTPREMATQLQQRGNIDEIAEKYQLQRPSATQLVLFIDQFEELFTLVDENYQQRFIQLLDQAIQSPYLRIILTVRADFHEHCLNYTALARLINCGAWHLASPDISSLSQMIVEPAKVAGLQFESGLVGEILRDTGTGSGALALMAFALEKLYLACFPNTTLTLQAYRHMGGVSLAIGRYAEEVYRNLEPPAQNALSDVFAELVTVDSERRVATRKRADFATVAKTAAARQLIDAFIEARLLVKNTINEIDAQMHSCATKIIVEVAHEAVLTHWDLLKEWIDVRLNDFCLLRQVELETTEWLRNNQSDANLWPHERLQQVYAMQQKLQPRLSAQALDFIRPEAERLLEKLNDSALTHQQRERIGMRLADIGDPRPGVGVDAAGLPQVEWCKVPPGRIVLENDAGTFNVDAFFIGQYPVTYKQYRAFLEAVDGYPDERWWIDLQHAPEPGEQYQTVDNHPADRVSWFDAIAFCRWLTFKLGYAIRLPSELEWQQAATGGCTENVFPWGPVFAPMYCNTFESGLGRTTAVGLYPQGGSPVGALDMSGNVWEWCANCYHAPEATDATRNACQVVRGGSWINYRVVRGGSWINYQEESCAVFRFRYTPGDRNRSLGFRLACSSPIIRTPEH